MGRQLTGEDERHIRLLIHEVSACCRFYGWTWHYVMSLPYGVFRAVVDEIPRLKAEEKRDMLDVQHTGDPKWLQERLTGIINYGLGGQTITDEQAADGWAKLQAAFAESKGRRKK